MTECAFGVANKTKKNAVHVEKRCVCGLSSCPFHLPGNKKEKQKEEKRTVK